MMVCLRKLEWGRVAAAAFASAAVLLSAAFGARAEGFAVVPTGVIYPGQEIEATQLSEVEITNPNLRGGYATSVGQVVGMISNQTLLPGRTVPIAALRAPYAVKRGSQLRLNFTIGNMVISAAGMPLQDAQIGDLIKVRNLDSGVIVSGTVLPNGSVQVLTR
ncbi:flagellar basal body P-ring formation chaperone FlgA [Rhizobium halophytocola]|uniref:Flagella basal body P-ring formation protein FlgA n=1 Tax=Rhizobium halophytocola TaxID=735519 RepID=A0ABS4E592_9HYPH|nr:flagellar basal body P-ring formation chaperone FlgA [Rhizobium halophytocola]MBP1853119.1 flagella basal body P-ring formation protein FlgA [Rhizobium halophytocola]